MPKRPIITLTTDYGLKDPFVGLMKGIIAGINPEALVIDLSHNIKRHDVFEASQVLAMSCRYFPPTTIHVAVVDPGVGSPRRPLLVVTEDYYFIGPDNGIFTPFFEESPSNFFRVYHITASHYWLPMRGVTFHGRDIFAPVAAWLSKGVESHKFGEEITDYIKIPLSQSATIEHGTINGVVISIDNFGNAITNITKDDLLKLTPTMSKDKFKVAYGERHLSMVDYYAEADASVLSAIINGFGHLELFIYRGNAAQEFGIKIGDSVSVTVV